MTRRTLDFNLARVPPVGPVCTLVLVLLTYVLSVTEYWHFAYAYSSHFGDLYNYQRNILQGHTDWVADQNRVLGPLLIALIQWLFGVDYESAYQHFLFYSFITFNMVALFLFHVTRLRPGEIGIGVLMAASVPMLLVNYWWFPWTVLEATLLLIAFAADAARFRLPVRVAVIGMTFGALTFTKETSALLPIWLVFRYGIPALIERQWRSLLWICVVCTAMLALSALIVMVLRHWLWVSGPDPNQPSGLPTNIPEFYGTHLLILASGVLDYYRQGFIALATFRLPWTVGSLKHWPDWPAGFVDFILMLGLSLIGTTWAFFMRVYDVLALSLTAVVYLVVCFALVNMPESDKLMPEVSIGLAVYALMCVRQRSQSSAPATNNDLQFRRGHADSATGDKAQTATTA